MQMRFGSILTPTPSMNTRKGAFFKDERSLGGRGGRPNAVTINNSDVIVLSNNDVILRSEGEGTKKGPDKIVSTYVLLVVILYRKPLGHPKGTSSHQGGFFKDDRNF